MFHVFTASLLCCVSAVAFNSTVFLPTAFLTNPCADNTPVLPVFGGFPYPSGNVPSAVNEIKPGGLLIPAGAAAPLPISCSAYDPVTDQLLLVSMTSSSLNFSSTGHGNATALAEEHYQAERISHSFALFTSNSSAFEVLQRASPDFRWGIGFACAFDNITGVFYLVGGNPHANATVVSLEPVSNMRGKLYQARYVDTNSPGRPPKALKYAAAVHIQSLENASAAVIVYGGAHFQTEKDTLTSPVVTSATYAFSLSGLCWYLLYNGGLWLPLIDTAGGVNTSTVYFSLDFFVYVSRGTASPTAVRATGPGLRVSAHSALHNDFTWYVYGGYTTAYDLNAVVACDMWAFSNSSWSRVGPTCACAGSLFCTMNNSLVAQYGAADLALDAATSTLYFVPLRSSYTDYDRTTPAAFTYRLGAEQWSVAALPGSKTLHLNPSAAPILPLGAFALSLQSRTSAFDSKRRTLYQTVYLPDASGSIAGNVHQWQIGSETCNSFSSAAVCRPIALLNYGVPSQALRDGKYTLGDFNSSYYCDCDELHGFNRTTQMCDVCPETSVSHMGSCQGISYCAPWASSSKRSLTRIINDTSSYIPATETRVLAPAWHSIPVPNDAITPEGAWNNYLQYTANVTNMSIPLPAITSEASCMDFDPLHRQVLLYAVTTVTNGFVANIYSLSLAAATAQPPAWTLLASNFTSLPVSVETWPPLGTDLVTRCSISVTKPDSRKTTPQMEFITAMPQVNESVPTQRLLTRALVEAPGYAYPGFSIGSASKWPVASSTVTTPTAPYMCLGSPAAAILGTSVYSKYHKMWLLKETINDCRETLFFSVDLTSAPQALSSTTRDGMFYHNSLKQGPSRTAILADITSAPMPFCTPNTEAMVAQDSWGLFVQIGGLCQDTPSDTLVPSNMVITMELVPYSNGTRGYVVKRWPSVSRSNGIAPRWGHAAAFDRDRNWIWVFGGWSLNSGSVVMLNDLQILDFSSKVSPLWRNDIRLPGLGSARPYGVGFPPPGPLLRGANIDGQSQGSWPSPRIRALMTYVPRMSGQMGGGHLVIVGGIGDDTMPLNDTHMLFLTPSHLCSQACWDYGPYCSSRNFQLTGLFNENQMLTADEFEWQAFPVYFVNTPVIPAAPEVDIPLNVGGYDASAFAFINQIGVRGLLANNMIFNGSMFPPGGWEMLRMPRILMGAGARTTRRTMTPLEPFGDTSFARNTETNALQLYYHDGYLLAWNLASRLPPQVSSVSLYNAAGVNTPIPYIPPRVTVDRPTLRLNIAWSDAQGVYPGPVCSMPAVRAALAATENHTVVSAQLYPTTFSQDIAQYADPNTMENLYCTALDSIDACGSDTIPWSLPAHSWKTAKHNYTGAPPSSPKPVAWLYAPCTDSSCTVAFISGDPADPALYGATVTSDGNVSVTRLHSTNGNLLLQFGDYGVDYMIAPAMMRYGLGACVVVLPASNRSTVYLLCLDQNSGSLYSDLLLATADSEPSIYLPLIRAACVYVVGSTTEEADFIICAGGVVLGGTTTYTSIGQVVPFAAINWTAPGTNNLPSSMSDLSVTHFKNVVYLTAGLVDGVNNWDLFTMTRQNNTWSAWTRSQLYATPAKQRNAVTLLGSTIWAREQQGKPYIYAYPSQEYDGTAGLWTLNPPSPVKRLWLSSDDVSRFNGVFNGTKLLYAWQAATVALPFGVLSLHQPANSPLETRSMVYGVHTCRATGATCRSLPAIPEAPFDKAASQHLCECGDPMYAGSGTQCFPINGCAVFDNNGDKFIDDTDVGSLYKFDSSYKCTTVLIKNSGQTLNGWAFDFNAWFPNATKLSFGLALTVNTPQTLTSLFGIGGKPALTVNLYSHVLGPSLLGDALLGMKLPDAFAGLVITDGAKVVDLHPLLFDGVSVTSSSKFVLQTSASGAGLRIPSTMLRLLGSPTGAPTRVTWLADGPAFPNRGLADNAYYCLNYGPQQAANATAGSVVATGTVRGGQMAGLDSATAAFTFNISKAAVIACATYRQQDVNLCSNSVGPTSTVVPNAYRVTQMPDLTKIMNPFAMHFSDGDAVYIITGDEYDDTLDQFKAWPASERQTALRLPLSGANALQAWSPVNVSTPGVSGFSLAIAPGSGLFSFGVSMTSVCTGTDSKQNKAWAIHYDVLRSKFVFHKFSLGPGGTLVDDASLIDPVGMWPTDLQLFTCAYADSVLWLYGGVTSSSTNNTLYRVPVDAEPVVATAFGPQAGTLWPSAMILVSSAIHPRKGLLYLMGGLATTNNPVSNIFTQEFWSLNLTSMSWAALPCRPAVGSPSRAGRSLVATDDSLFALQRPSNWASPTTSVGVTLGAFFLGNIVYRAPLEPDWNGTFELSMEPLNVYYNITVQHFYASMVLIDRNSSLQVATSPVPRNVQHVMFIGGLPHTVTVDPQNIYKQTIAISDTPFRSAVHLMQIGTHNCSADQICKWGDTTGRYACFDGVDECVIRDVFAPDNIFYLHNSSAATMSCTSILLKNCTYAYIGPRAFYRSDVLSSDDILVTIRMEEVVLTAQTEWTAPFKGLTALRNIALTTIDAPYPFKWMAGAAPSSSSLERIRVTDFPSLVELGRNFIANQPKLQRIGMQNTGLYALPARMFELVPPSPILAVVDFTNNINLTTSADECASYQGKWSRSLSLLNLTYSMQPSSNWNPRSVCTWVEDVNECGISTDPWIPNGVNKCRAGCTNLVYPYYPAGVPAGYTCDTVCTINNVYSKIPLNRSLVAAALVNNTCKSLMIAHSTFTAAWRAQTNNEGNSIAVLTGVEPDAFLELTNVTLQISFINVNFRFVPTSTSTTIPFGAIVSVATSWYITPFPYYLFAAFRDLLSLRLRISTDMPIDPDTISFVWGLDAMPRLQDLSIRMTPQISFMEQTLIPRIKRSSPMLRSISLDIGEILHFGAQIGFPNASQNLTVAWSPMHPLGYDWSSCDAHVLAALNGSLNNSAVPFSVLNPSFIMSSMLVSDGSMVSMPETNLKMIPRRACQIFANVNQCGTRSPATSTVAWRNAISPPDYAVNQVGTDATTSICNVTGAAYAYMPDLGVALVWGGRLSSASPMASYSCADGVKFWNSRLRSWAAPAKVVGSLPDARLYAAAAYVPHLRAVLMYGGADSRKSSTNAMNGQRHVPLGQQVMLLSVLQDDAQQPDIAYLVDPLPVATVYAAQVTLDDASASLLAPRVGASSVFVPTVGIHGSVLFFGGSPNATAIGSDAWGLGIGPMENITSAYNPVQAGEDLIAWDVDTFRATTIRANEPCTRPPPTNWSALNGTSPAAYVPCVAMPPGRSFHVAVYDSRADAMIIHGGEAWMDVSDVEFNASDPSTAPRQWGRSIMGDVRIFDVASRTWQDRPYLSTEWAAMYDHGVFTVRRSRHSAALDPQTRLLYLFGGIGFKEPANPGHSDKYMLPTGAYGNLGDYPVLLDDVIVYDLQRQVWDRPPALHKRLRLLPSGLWFPGASQAGVTSLGGMAWFDEVQREFVVTSGADKLPTRNDFTSTEGFKAGATIITDGSTPCNWNAGYECTDLEDTRSSVMERENQCTCPGPVYNTVYNRNTITSCLYCPRCPRGYFDDQGCLVGLGRQIIEYTRNCKPWTVCTASEYEWTPPNATSDRVCKAFPGPVMPICPAFTLAGVVSPAVPPSRTVCLRPESSPIYSVVTGPDANLYPAGRTFGDICYVSCGSTLFGWGPSVYMCGDTGNWVPAIAIDRNNAPIWPVDPSNIASSVRFRGDATGAASFASPSYACYDLTPPPIGTMSGGTCGVGMAAKWQLSGPLRGFATLQALAAQSWSTSAEATAQIGIARAALTHSAASYRLIGLLTDNSTGQFNASQVTTLGTATTIVVYVPTANDVRAGAVQLELYLPIMTSMLRAAFGASLLSAKNIYIAVQAIGHAGSVSDVRWGPNLALRMSTAANNAPVPLLPLVPNTCEPIYFLPLATNVALGAFTLPQRLIVSDSLAPAMGVFAARKNPTRSEVVRIRCVTSAPVNFSPFEQFIAGGTSTVSFVGANVSLAVSMGIEHNTSTQVARIFTATCDVSSSYPSQTLLAPVPFFNFTQQISFELAVVRTFWPFFRDVVLEIPKQPLVRSAWSSYPANATQLTQSLHVVNSSAIFDKLRVAANVSQSPTNNSVFTLTVSGAANITLVGDDVSKLDGGPMFSMDTKVYVGNIPCQTTAVSGDGRLLRVLTPPYDVACPNTNTKRSCGILPITINNTQENNPSAITVLAAATASLDAFHYAEYGYTPLDATISCPPFCPGSGGAASFVANGSYPTRSLVPTSPYVRSSGLLYVLKCSEAFGTLFADPATGVCSDVNNPLSRTCAFGEGDACRACPMGALCPGGFRAHPLYGYWSQDETSDDVLKCRPPAGRCLGWSDANYSSVCGDGFRQGSYACSSCAVGYYPSDAVTCTLCPEPNLWNMLKPILSFIGGLAAVGLAVLGVVIAVTRQAGGDPKVAARQTAQFVLYCWVALQSMVQVGRAAGPGLPSFLAGAYSAIAALQFQGVSMPPACLQDANPFQGEYAQMGVVIILMLMLVLLQFNYRRWCGCYCCGVGRDLRPMVQQLQPSPTKAKLGEKRSLQPSARRSSLMHSIRNIAGSQSVRMLAVGSRMDTSKPRLRKLVFTLMTLLYATVTNSTLGVLHCTPITTSVRSYLSLESDGTTLRTAGITRTFDPACVSAACDDADQLAVLGSSVSVSVLSSNPSYVCYEGFHWQAAVVAWTVFVIYVVAYPVLTFALVARRSRQIMLRGSTGNSWMQARTSKQAWKHAWVSTAPNAFIGAWRRARMSWICGSQQPPKPLTSPSPPRRSSTSAITKPTTADAIMDTNEELLQNVSLSHFTSSDFRISRFYFKQLDMVVLFALSCILVFWSRPTSSADAIAKMAATLALLLVQAYLIGVHRPFAAGQQWKHGVKIYILLLTALCAVVNAVQFTGGSDVSLPTSVLVLSIICAALGVGLMAFLLVSFLYFIWRGATTVRMQKEKAQLAEQQAVTRLHTMNPLAQPHHPEVEDQSSAMHSSPGSAPLRRALRRGSSTAGLMDEEAATAAPLAAEAKAARDAGSEDFRMRTAGASARGLRGSFVATSTPGLQSIRSANRILSQKRVGSNRSAVTPTSQSRPNTAGTPTSSTHPRSSGTAPSPTNSHSRPSMSPSPQKRNSTFAMANPLLQSPKR